MAQATLSAAEAFSQFAHGKHNGRWVIISIELPDDIGVGADKDIARRFDIDPDPEDLVRPFNQFLIFVISFNFQYLVNKTI